MGLLDGLLGGGQRSGGGISPLTMGLMGLLAYRTFQGQGRLADMLGTGKKDAGGPQVGGGEQGGIGGMLGQIFGGGSNGRAAGPDWMSGLGGLLGGGAAGGILGQGLTDLLKKFQDNGQSAKAQSWVNSGPNEEIAPENIERSVGRDAIQTLAERSGRTYQDVLAELSRDLPKAVDKLTPEGRMPTKEETARW